MMFVPIKNIEQQEILAVHSARSLLVKQQTMLANAMRGLATEFRLTVPKGIGRLDELLKLVDADKAFPEKARQVFMGLFVQCRALTKALEHSKLRSSLTPGTMKPPAAYRRSLALVRSPRR